MSTPNFSYKNRCVVLTDSDCDNGYFPSFHNDKRIRINRSYPSYVLDIQENKELVFYQIIMTTGYYSGACIDYRDKEDLYGRDFNFEYNFTDDFYYTGVYHDDDTTEVITENVMNFFKNNYGFEIPKDVFEAPQKSNGWDECMDYIKKGIAYLKAEEEKKVNKLIDTIRDDYGYSEYKTAVIFSNGEALYEQIA